MEFLGDLERAFATLIYPNRVLVGAVLAVVLVGLAILAWRRRWDLAARRHPRRTLTGLAVALAVGGPIAWYLGSPLFISTTIDEAPPVVAGVPSAEPSEMVPEASATPAPPQVAPPAGVARSGEFEGADEFHFGEGTARLLETAPGAFVVRLEDFAVRNGPDLYVYLSPSPDGYAEPAIEIGRLKADRGNQNYEVPPGVDVDGTMSVVIWCKQFAVEFATAPLR